ncbi:VOC family protein [Actinoallomurus sp. NBC_01490]|uniref:VOC family protein n=1 Tax=Actinoallomurus sp. NBC_01490 TaxID=2903557 RepID=UPI002E31CF1B|nr:VOC family protein [Actinoallomurus sp. NBC_01490]
MSDVAHEQTGPIGVVFETLDPGALARFWAGALNGTTPEENLGGEQTVIRTGDTVLRLRFTPATRPKTTKNRLHLDLAGGSDPAREVERVLALGASRADIGQGEVPWTVLADPEGNEFCVLPEEGSAGRLAAICLDAADPDVQGRFWAPALGWRIVDQGDWGISLRSPSVRGPRMVMGPPAAAKAGRNRLLLEIAAHGDDPATAADRLTRTGATRADAERTGLLADPEGNEFLLAAR